MYDTENAYMEVEIFGDNLIDKLSKAIHQIKVEKRCSYTEMEKYTCLSPGAAHRWNKTPEIMKQARITPQMEEALKEQGYEIRLIRTVRA